MLNILIEHAPHIVPAVIVGGAILWLYLRDLRTEPSPEERERLAQWHAEQAQQRAQRLPRRSVARASVALLVTLAAVFVTSIALFVDEVAGGPKLPTVLWAHVAVALLLCALVVAKIKAIGWTRLRRTLRFETLFRVSASVVLATLLVPLLVTGTIMIFDPGTSGFPTRLHLLVAVWFGALALAHTIKLAPATFAQLRHSQSVRADQAPLGRSTQPEIVSSPRPRGAAGLRAARRWRDRIHTTTREGKV